MNEGQTKNISLLSPLSLASFLFPARTSSHALTFSLFLLSSDHLHDSVSSFDAEVCVDIRADS